MDETTAPPAIASGIESIRRRWPAVLSPSAEEPIFVLAAGWRSGSTLLQRLLMPRAFLWGEPFGHAGLIEDLARPLAAFGGAWPPDAYFYGGQPAGALAERFIANLYPDPQSLLDAHLAYFERLLIEPARHAANSQSLTQPTRWGLKEVRLSADHAAYLKWLFPRAKLLFLIRNPWDAYRSYAARGQQWFVRWPDQPLTPKTLAQAGGQLRGRGRATGRPPGAL
ncbi:MAG TPA: sulfotransferase [Pirellulales bacterium]|nr:sulfotransferase [Pirellulales bacterium]